MPEAPEVEAVVQTLRPLVRGKRISHVRVRHDVAVRPQSPAFLDRRAAGTRIRDVERRGKYLFLALDDGYLAMHFKFDGQLLWFEKAQRALARNTHLDVLFEMSDGVLGFVDPRHLGRVQWLAKPEDSPGIKALGVDAFSALFTLPRFIEICRTRPRPLKILLMDQTRIAGVGNIYATEALWRARISPWHGSEDLTPAKYRALHKAVVSVLARALECCLHPPPDFRNRSGGLAESTVCFGFTIAKAGAAGAAVRRSGGSNRAGDRPTFAPIASDCEP